ncbi:MAG: DUF1552 domain-containing protein [Myxococcota bacterium]|nr:DUF1552 domain-containing protein [Myxococcota bacterium]
MMKRDLRFSRRNLLQAIGAGAALLPLLESDRADAACLVGGIKRLYILVWPDGMLSNVNTWSPPGDTPTSWTLAPFQSALQPYMSDLLLLQGVDYKFIRDMPGSGERTGHACFPGMLTGKFYQALSASTGADLAGGPSIDQYIGSQLQQAHGYKGLVSLNQGVFVKSTGHLSWKGPGQVVLPNPDPYNVFSTYFQGAIPTPPPATTDGGAPPPAPVDNSRLVRKSILDYVIKDLNRFGSVVGAADKQSIDAHLTSVRQIEMQLQALQGTGTVTPMMGAGPITMSATGNAACTTPKMSGAPLDVTQTANVPAVTQLQIDLGIAAFASDLTRVVVLQIADQGAANLVLSWLGFVGGTVNPSDPKTGDMYGFHSIAHRNDTDKVKCDAWFQTQIAYILHQLKGITDPTGKSMLDSSVVVGMNNMRTGTHETTGVPVVMAGSCGGYFKTGRSLALPAGTAHNGLLVALCNAMGTPVATFGEPSYGGELTVLKG